MVVYLPSYVYFYASTGILQEADGRAVLTSARFCLLRLHTPVFCACSICGFIEFPIID